MEVSQITHVRNMRKCQKKVNEMRIMSKKMKKMRIQKEKKMNQNFMFFQNQNQIEKALYM